MTPSLPKLEQFRIELKDNGLVHLVFDAPGRSMNVFSDAAIVEIGLFARWLAEADVRGALIRSGKESGFCAGANLPEIWAAYDMVTATPRYRALQRRLRSFLSPEPRPARAGDLRQTGRRGGRGPRARRRRRTRARRALSRADDDPRAAIGLPESLVGLLPGAGGTQRLPRLIGVEAAMPILLEGGRLSGEAALKAGLAHAVVDKGRGNRRRGGLVALVAVADPTVGPRGLGLARLRRR